MTEPRPDEMQLFMQRTLMTETKADLLATLLKVSFDLDHRLVIARSIIDTGLAIIDGIDGPFSQVVYLRDLADEIEADLLRSGTVTPKA